MSDTARVAWVCIAALAVFAIWAVVHPSASAGIGFFYVVPIGLATWWGGWRYGAIALVACTLLWVAGALVEPIPHAGASLAARLVAFAAALGMVALLRRRMVELEHSAEELEAIRAALTPPMLPELPGLDAAAAFVPSEYGVSGDFYLVTNGPDRSTVAIVGDVVGHGPEAARLATFIRARFAAFAASTSDPAELLMLANLALVDRPVSEHELVSAVCLRFREEDGLAWATAGHPSPMLLPELDELAVESAALPLGADPELSLTNCHASPRNGEGVVIYTDGATDVRREGALLGRDGLSRLLAPLAELPARPMAARAEEAILGWADGPIHDDLCVLVVRPKQGLNGNGVAPSEGESGGELGTT